MTVTGHVDPCCHSRTPSPRSFWLATGIESSGSSGLVQHRKSESPRFTENTKRILSVCSEKRVRPEFSEDTLCLFHIVVIYCFFFKKYKIEKNTPSTYRALDPCRRPEGSWALGTRIPCCDNVLNVVGLWF